MRSLTGIDTCLIVPEVIGYSAKPSMGSISAKLAGPASRYGNYLKNGAISVTLNWEIMYDTLSYLRAFYRQKTKRGAKPFLVPLILDKHEVGLYFTMLIPKTMRIAHITGMTYRVSASAEVERHDYA